MPDDLPTSPRSDDEIEREAHICRMKAGNPDEFAPDILNLIHSLASRDHRFAKLKIEVRRDSELPDAEARAFVQDQIIEIRESVFEQAKKHVPRARMTVAHELGHVVLNHVGTPKYRKTTAIKPANVAPHRSEERQANVFAAALLMPRAFVISCTCPEDVSERMAVSLEAARIRYSSVKVRSEGKSTPPDIAQSIRNLKESTKESKKTPSSSVLQPEQARRLAWELASCVPDHDSNEYRCIDNRWIIRWSRFGESKSGGWSFKNGIIVAWDDENSR